MIALPAARGKWFLRTTPSGSLVGQVI